MLNKSFIYTFVWSITILVFCLMPSSSISRVHVPVQSFDKVLHFLIFLIFTWTLTYGFTSSTDQRGLSLKCTIICFVISVLYGGLIEVLQYILTQDRHGDWFDLLADAVGVIVALLTYRLGNVLLSIPHKLLSLIMLKRK